jgi:hypothetical protein
MLLIHILRTSPADGAAILALDSDIGKTLAGRIRGVGA